MKEVGVSTVKDPVCEVCGSAGFEAFLCNCCKCNDCYEHVYCMRENLQYIPDTWTCDECLLLNSSSYEPMSDTVGELDVKTSVEKNQSDFVPNLEEKEEGALPTVSDSVTDDINSDDLVEKILTEASDNYYADHHSKWQSGGMDDSKNKSRFGTHAEKALPGVSLTPEYGVSGASHSDEQCQKAQAPPKALGITNDGPLYEEQDYKILPKELDNGNTQTLCNSVATFADMRACSIAERERIDNLDLKMRRVAEELHSLWKNIEKARRKLTEFPRCL